MSTRTRTISGPPARLRMRAVRITVLNGPDAPLSVVCERDPVCIGTDPDNDVQLTDTAVSKEHLRLRRTPLGYRMQDCASRNGTWLGGARVEQAEISGPQRVRLGVTEALIEPLQHDVEITTLDAGPPGGMIGVSGPMMRLYALIDRIAPTGLSVLVLGETGTGKELVSRALHDGSSRADGPFVVFDCGAVPANLIESELFGHVKGAFTGAHESRAGAFEQAHGGTLFVDELGELPLELQTRLLRVLESGQTKRLGEARHRTVDVRLVAATNRDLSARVAAGTFRSDLYYRVAVVEISIPPLRDRLHDIPALVPYLMAQAPLPSPPDRVSEGFLQMLAAWHWPGNVRELRNVVFRAAALCVGGELTVRDLPGALRSANANELTDDGEHVPLPGADHNWRDARSQVLEAFERNYLADLLERADGRLDRASAIAGLDKRTIRRLLKLHNLVTTD